MTYGLTHDPKSGALYIRLREGEYKETLDFGNPGGGVNVDIDCDGYVLGLEFLSLEEYAEVIAEYGGELVLPERIVDESGGPTPTLKSLTLRARQSLAGRSRGDGSVAPSA